MRRLASTPNFPKPLPYEQEAGLPTGGQPCQGIITVNDLEIGLTLRTSSTVCVAADGAAGAVAASM